MVVKSKTPYTIVSPVSPRLFILAPDSIFAYVSDVTVLELVT
jgi:hypothetical protein